MSIGSLLYHSIVTLIFKVRWLKCPPRKRNASMTDKQPGRRFEASPLMSKHLISLLSKGLTMITFTTL